MATYTMHGGVWALRLTAGPGKKVKAAGQTCTTVRKDGRKKTEIIGTHWVSTTSPDGGTVVIAAIGDRDDVTRAERNEAMQMVAEAALHA